MSFVAISDFKYGLDHRRPRIAGAPGTLWDIKNAHITRGGDIERAKKFVPIYTLPAASTFGLAQVAGKLWTFGSANVGGVMPLGVSYQRLIAENGANMVGVLDTKSFTANLYVIAEYDDGNVRHFYNGARVTDWDALSDGNSSFNTLTDYLASKLNGDVDVQAQASGNQILLTGRNNNAPFTLTGSAANGGGTNDQTITFVTAQAASPTQPQISTITLGGTFEALDLFTVIVNGRTYKATGRASGIGLSAFIYKGRVYSPANTLLRYSKLNDPSNWVDTNASTGAGFINISNQVEGAERLLAVGKYNGLAAIFSSQSITIYTLDADATQVSLFQNLDNTGTLAARAVISFGNTDLFYLDTTGIRSIKARDASNSAVLNDLGSAIDPIMQTWIQSVGATVTSQACGAIEPLDNRYWLAIGSRIYVFSYFPSSNIAAWSYYEPGINVTAFAKSKQRIYARAADTIYLYGGVNGSTYPNDNEQPISVALPFISAQSLGTWKNWQSLDIGASGQWMLSFLPEPKNEANIIPGGTFVDTSYADQGIASIVGDTPMFALKLDCTKGGYASLSSVVAHFQKLAD